MREFCAIYGHFAEQIASSKSSLKKQFTCAGKSSERTMVNLAKIERARQPSPPPPLLSRGLPRASPSSRSSSPRGPSRSGFSRSQSSLAAGLLQCAPLAALAPLAQFIGLTCSLFRYREIFCRSVGVQPSRVLANVAPRAAARCLVP